MAFENGTLLAADGDVLEQLMDIMQAFLSSAGWTENLYDDYGWDYALGIAYRGKRLHVQKTIGGHDRFINIRSVSDQEAFGDTSSFPVTGIVANASTAYDGATHNTSIISVSNIGGLARLNTAGSYASEGDTVTVTGTTDYNGVHTVAAGSTVNTIQLSESYVSSQTGSVESPSRWDTMTGYTATGMNTTGASSGCGAIDLSADSLSYWLFSQNGDDNIYLVCQNSTGYTGIVFGATTTGNFFLSGSSVRDAANTNPNALLTRLDGIGVFALRKSDNSAWLDWPANGIGDSAIPLTHSTNSPSSVELESSIASRLLQVSPDNFKGNNPLIPTYMGVVQGNTPPEHQFAGTVEGIKYVNMKFIDSLTELTFGGDVYVLFRLYSTEDSNDATIGLAMLK